MISILVSCLYTRLADVANVIKPVRRDVEYVVVVQGAGNKAAEHVQALYTWSRRGDVRLIIDPNIGVTHSRNLALENAVGDIVLFSDDDVTLSEDCFELLISSFREHPACAFLTFDVEDEDGSLLKPPLSTGLHTFRTIMGVGTIQIAVKLAGNARNYRFPVDLGAGAKYPCCDEPVYLASFLKDGKKGSHIARTICRHPRESSGGTLDSREKIISRLIAFRYIFGPFLGSVAFAVFIAKNLKRIMRIG